MPRDIALQIRDGAIAPTFPSYRGEYGTAVAELRGELESLPEATRTISSVLRSFAGEVEIACSQITEEDLGAQIDAWQLAAELADQAARCTSASSQASSSMGGTASAAAQCAAAAVRMAASIATTIIRSQIRDESVAQIGTGVAIRFGERMDQLQQAQSNLARGFSRVNGLLSRLETQRGQARRHAARVLFEDEDSVGREYQVNRVTRARMSTLRIRYERAHRNAIRLAYLARRAIEQRLAVDMSTMTDEMTLVPAPATWADGLCSMRGIDYAELRGDGDSDVTDYADRFVGDYVRLLQLFIESYRLDYPFTDGDDVALVSLRDDVLGARRSCAVTGHNLLAWSSDLSHGGDSTVPEASGWLSECVEGERCVVAVADEGSPFRAEGEGVPGTTDRVTRLRSMGESRAVAPISACPLGRIESDGTCTATVGGARYQDAYLGVGDYLFSWYERLPTPLDTAARRTTCTDSACVASCVAAGGSEADCGPECVDETCLQEACAGVPLSAVPDLTGSSFSVAIEGLDPEGLPVTGDAP